MLPLQVMKHAFTYYWKLWTIPEVLEMLQEAGFAEVHVWMRCMLVSQASRSNCQVHVTCLLLQPSSVQLWLVRSCLWLWLCAYAGLDCVNNNFMACTLFHPGILAMQVHCC